MSGLEVISETVPAVVLGITKVARTLQVSFRL